MKKFVLRMKKTGRAKIDVQRRYFGFLWRTIARFDSYSIFLYDDNDTEHTSDYTSDCLNDAERRAKEFIDSYCDIRLAERLVAERERALCKRLKTPVVVTCDHVNNA